MILRQPRSRQDWVQSRTISGHCPDFGGCLIVELEELQEIGFFVVIDAFGDNDITAIPSHEPCIVLNDEHREGMGLVLEAHLRSDAFRNNLT